MLTAGRPVTERAVGIAVLAKAPIPGLAKTRLIPALGARGAARLQRRLTLQTLQVVQAAQAAQPAPAAQAAGLGDVTLWCAPDASHPFFRSLARRTGIACRAQCDGDLGRRMQHAFEARGHDGPLLLIGTDCPPLTPTHLVMAAAALGAGDDAVLLPAQDGGYVLIGLRRPLPGLFDGVDWGTDRVLAQTRARLRSIGARWQEGETLWDVDRPADLLRLRQDGPPDRG